MNETNKNKGFSLIELVVTVCIMGIVVLISVNLYGRIRSAEMKSAAENIDSSLSSLRSKSLAKAGEYKLNVSMNSSGNYVVSILEYTVTTEEDGSVSSDWVVIESEKLGSSITISGLDDAGTDTVIESGDRIEIQCSKSNGSFTYSKLIQSDGTELNVEQIKIKKGDTAKVVKLVRSTGRHYID